MGDLSHRLVKWPARSRMRGEEQTQSPWGCVTEYKDGMAIRIRTYLDPNEALEAAGLSE